MPFLNSLESKLITASIVIVVVVLALAGAVFVVARRGDQRQQELDQVSANATAIQREFLLRQLVRAIQQSSLARFVDDAAGAYDVRALMVDSNGQVFADSAGDLEGARIAFEGSVTSKGVVADGDSAAYVTWRPAEGSPGSGLVLLGTPDIAIAPPPFGEIGFGQPRYSLRACRVGRHPCERLAGTAAGAWARGRHCAPGGDSTRRASSLATSHGRWSS